MIAKPWGFRLGRRLMVARLVFGIVAFPLAGCGATDSPGMMVDPPSSTDAAPVKVTAAVGDALELSGGEGLIIDGVERQGDLRLRITLLQLVDPAPAEEFLPPSPDNRLVAIQVRLENIGSAVYSDSPGTQFVLIDSVGQLFQSAPDSQAGPALSSFMTMAPGDTRVGFITYELPSASTPSTVQVALDGPFAPETGEWSLT